MLRLRRFFQLVGQSDDLLKNAWQERNWAAFIRVWLWASVGLMVFFFVYSSLYFGPFIFNQIREGRYSPEFCGALWCHGWIVCTDFYTTGDDAY